MELEHLSASRIKKFKQCELCYFSHYILGIEEPIHPLTNMGSACHRMFELSTIARIAGQKESNPLEFKDQATKEFGVEDSLFPLIDELTANALKWGYFRNIKRTVGCEMEFEFFLPNGIKVKGMIDRLDVNAPTADIIDLKTQKSKFDDEELRDNWQAKIYNIGARVLKPEITGRVSVSFWVLRHQVQKAWLTARDVARDMAALEKVGEEIRACTDPKPSPSSLCNYCGYKGKCIAGKMKARKR